MDCIFCKIIKGEIPSHKVYEDDYVIAILDISQVTKGHTLIIPKKHSKNLYELDENLSKDIFKVLPKISNYIKSAFNPIGMNVIINVDKPLQSVDHLHIHLVPRYENDDFDIKFTNNQNKLTKDDFQNIQNSIIKEIEKDR